jgi:2-oxo-4-hydroxy-4-carboxy-5-ureidoimidazoline decarboxylase
MTATVTLTDLNAGSKDTFVAALGGVFEQSPWVAEQAWAQRPFASLDALHAAMTHVVGSATEAEQLALLCAHPDLGTRARVSDASTGEQRGAGLDRLTPDEFARLQRLNAEYRGRFGFPFLFAVKGSTTHDVLSALAARATRTRDEEFAEALQQVYKIARFRLEEACGATR